MKWVRFGAKLEARVSCQCHDVYRVAQKIGTIFCTPQLYQIVADFLNYFTVRIREKICKNTILKIPPRLKCVGTLPCEMSSVLKVTVKNKTTSEVKRPTLILTKFFINKQNFRKTLTKCQ